MKRTVFFFLAVVFVQGLSSYAQNNPFDRKKDAAKSDPPARQAQPDRKEPPARQVSQEQPASQAQPVRQEPAARLIRQAQPVRKEQPAPQPVVININRPSVGRNNKTFQPVEQPVDHPMTYGLVQSPIRRLVGPQPSQSTAQPVQPTKPYRDYLVAGQASNPAFRASDVAHHHPYTPGYVRKRLQKIGVKTSPGYITDRAEIIATDRPHSAIRFPAKGPDNRPLLLQQVTSRHLNDDVVRKQITLVSGDDFHRRLLADNARETRSNQYYWHKDNGFDYCHYIDGSGYHWYGWYTGDRFFWTRNFGGRWWSYDSDYGRWNFWNDGFWWWQDPFHVGDLYCYTNDGYIPANCANDQIIVTSTDQTGAVTYNSSDGTRTVKVFTEAQDAFLYDTANPPTFDPIYLASGVQGVQFSDTANGRPLQVILKLKDGSFDMFDAMGTPFLSGRSDDNPDSVGAANTP